MLLTDAGRRLKQNKARQELCSGTYSYLFLPIPGPFAVFPFFLSLLFSIDF